ncbi:MAG: DUF2135 domain-containing protein [Myxococcales bacterium]
MTSLVLVLLLAQAANNAPQRQSGVPIGRGTTPPVVHLTSPSGGWSVDRMMKVEGTISDPTVDPVVLSVNGDRYLLRTSQGRFSRKFPAAAGRNVVTALATNKGGTGRAQATFYAQVPSVPFKAVLTSDTFGVYTDLHLYEPTDRSSKLDAPTLKDMAHVFWADTASPSGGTFFLNEQDGDFDQPGYGPYLYIHRAPPHGLYVIAANYWPSGDQAHTIATLNLSLFEGTPQELRRVVKIPLATPGTTRVLAIVNLLGEGRALIYVPANDPFPSEAAWPRNLRELAQGKNVNLYE